VADAYTRTPAQEFASGFVDATIHRLLCPWDDAVGTLGGGVPRCQRPYAPNL